ncbi:cysteine desulfurase family protein, partial [Saccharopolyspora rectivirgula]
MTYLDHAATTPMRPRAAAVMSEALTMIGNASSLHTSGRRARRAVEESREDIADALGARPSEVIFTGGGTEGDNLAVKGIYWGRRKEDPARRRVLASSVEHHAVLDAVEWLAEHEGAEVTWLPVDSCGRVQPEVLEEAIAEAPDEVALATVMWANNEVGTVNPIRELAEVANRYGVPLHTDAVQAVETLPVDFAASGAAALTMTGHKVGGPCGAGVLLLGRDVKCVPVLHGGGQEREVRSGTMNTPAVLGLAAAVREAVDQRSTHVPQLTKLRDELI